MGQRGGWFPRNATDRSVRAKDPRHPGSLRTGSHNAQPAAEEFFWADIEVTPISLGDFSLPICKQNPVCPPALSDSSR
jgi:hypothetical protein